MNITDVAAWITARIKEPSTHAAIAIAIQAAKSHYPQYGDLIDAATLLFAAIAGALAESKTQPQGEQK